MRKYYTIFPRAVLKSYTVHDFTRWKEKEIETVQFSPDMIVKIEFLCRYWKCSMMVNYGKSGHYFHSHLNSERLKHVFKSTNGSHYFLLLEWMTIPLSNELLVKYSVLDPTLTAKSFEFRLFLSICLLLRSLVTNVSLHSLIRYFTRN